MPRIGFLLVVLFASLPAFGMTGINISEAIEIGGIKQQLLFKGVDDKNPVLLFLHGGPGSSAMSYADKFTGELQKHFVVVFWDQRETGATKKINTSKEPLTVALFENDAVEVINYLKTRFAKEKIFLMGHSWGGFLGMMVASDHPDLLACYIAISPMIYQAESERMSLEMMLEYAKRHHENTEAGELLQVRIPFENGDQLYYHRKWLAITMGQKPPPRNYVKAWSITWLNLFNEASQVNFLEKSPEIKCPIYFMDGSKDYQTHFKLLDRYCQLLKADKKGLFWFENSGHLLNLTEPAKMQDIIIKQILPAIGK